MPKQHNGYSYSKDGTSSDWQKTYYRCVAYKTVKCKARLLETSDGTVRETGEPHSCRQPGRDAAVCCSDGSSLVQEPPPSCSDSNLPAAEAPHHPSLYGWFQRDETVFVHKGHKYVWVDSGEPAPRPWLRHYACVNGHQGNADCPARLERVDDRDPTLTIPHSRNCGSRSGQPSKSSSPQATSQVKQSLSPHKKESQESPEYKREKSNTPTSDVPCTSTATANHQEDQHSFPPIKTPEYKKEKSDASDVPCTPTEYKREKSDASLSDVPCTSTITANHQGDQSSFPPIKTHEYKREKSNASTSSYPSSSTATASHQGDQLSFPPIKPLEKNEPMDTHNEAESRGDVERASRGDGERASPNAGERASQVDGERASQGDGEQASQGYRERAFQNAGERGSQGAGEDNDQGDAGDIPDTQLSDGDMDGDTKALGGEDTEYGDRDPEIKGEVHTYIDIEAMENSDNDGDDEVHTPNDQQTTTPQTTPNAATSPKSQRPKSKAASKSRQTQSPKITQSSMGFEASAHAPRDAYSPRQTRGTQTPKPPETRETPTPEPTQERGNRPPQLIPQTRETQPPQRVPQTQETQPERIPQTREIQLPQARETQTRRSPTPQLPQSSMPTENGADALWLRNLGHRVSEIRDERRRKRLKLDLDEMVLKAQREDISDD